MPEQVPPLPYAARASLVGLFALWLSFASAYRLLIDPVNQRDTNKPVYELQLPPIGQIHSSKIPVQIDGAVSPMQMVTALGQVMTCMLPDPAPETEQNLRVSDPEAIFDDIDDLFKQFENMCFIRQESWWTYEFCYGKHVIQKHILSPDREHDKSEVADEFVLGLFDSEADKIRRKNVSQVSTPDAAFTQLFTNGTVCDMTNKPRRATVKYLCSEETVQLSGASFGKTASTNTNGIYEIREVESCVYEVKFINAAICRHSTYRAKQARNHRPVPCSMEEGEQPFKGLAASTYQRSSLYL